MIDPISMALMIGASRWLRERMAAADRKKKEAEAKQEHERKS